MNTTGTFLRSAWVTMLILASTFLFGARSASAECHLASSSQSVVLEAKAGTDGVSTTIVITNNGTDSVLVHGKLSGDNASLFTVTPMEFRLAGGGKKEVTVKFSLINSTLEKATATLTFSVGTSTCLTIPLYGTKAATGGDNHLVVDPASFTFTAADSGHQNCKDFIVTNKGTATAYIQGWAMGDVYVAANNDWVVSADAKAAYSLTAANPNVIEVQAGATVKISLCYTPLAKTVASSKGSIVVKYSYTQNPTEWNKLTISFNANGNQNSGGDNYITIDPAKYVFPATDSGKQICKEFVVKNMGKATVFISAWLLSTDSHDFTMDASTTQVLEIAAGASTTIHVCYNASGNRAQQSGYLTVKYSFILNVQEYSKANAYFSTSGDVNHDTPCLGSEPKNGDMKIGVLLGASSDVRFLVLTNKTQAVVKVNSVTVVGEDAKAFVITATLPVEIAVGGSVEIPYIFTPFAINGAAKEYYSAHANFELTGTASGGVACKAFSATLYGLSLKVHHDGDKDSNGHSIAIPISEKKVIGLVNIGIKQTYTLLFVNNLDVDVTVKSISMRDGIYYKVTAPDASAMPFVVKPNETFTVSISFESSDRFVHKDALVIVADHMATNYEFDFEGINSAAASVKNTLPEGVAISVSPVPSHSDVSVVLGGVRSAQIEVIDLLGNTISSAKATTDWKWIANGAGNGSYIVRISGVSTNGESFVTSKRIILAK